MIGLGACQISVQGAQPTASNEAPPDYRFKIEVLARGMPRPMLLHLAPDGRIFFNELGGKLKIWKPSGEVVEAGSVRVPQRENGSALR